MAKGFTLYVDGEEVFKTEEPALRVTIGAEQGELAAFATNEINNIHVNVEYEGVLNRHLHDVERVQREERRKATEERLKERGPERKDLGGSTTAKKTTAASGSKTDSE